MEIIIYSPNFYLHLQDALVVVQYCIDGIIHLAAKVGWIQTNIAYPTEYLEENILMNTYERELLN